MESKDVKSTSGPEMKGKERSQSLCHLIPSPEEVELGTCMLFQTLSANHSTHCYADFKIKVLGNMGH